MRSRQKSSASARPARAASLCRKAASSRASSSLGAHCGSVSQRMCSSFKFDSWYELRWLVLRRAAEGDVAQAVTAWHVLCLEAMMHSLNDAVMHTATWLLSQLVAAVAHLQQRPHRRGVRQRGLIQRDGRRRHFPPWPPAAHTLPRLRSLSSVQCVVIELHLY